jgi:hypothetical protein
MKEDPIGSDRLDDFLHEIMQEGGLERAPGGFTQQVMAQITAEQAAKRAAPAKVRWRPVISRWGWVGIAASLMVVLVLTLGLPWKSGVRELPGKAAVSKAMDATVSAFGSLEFPAILVMCVAAVFLLFALDRVLAVRGGK